MDGYIDEVRVSNTVRYTTGFTPAVSAFTDDANTLVLNHFDSASNINPTVISGIGPASNLPAGTYTLNVTDTASYSATKVYTVLQPINLTAGTVTNASSYGSATGSIGVTTVAGGNGVYTYAWVSTNGGTTISAQTPAAKTLLSAGTYTLTVTDTASYSATKVYTVLQPIQITPGAKVNIDVYGQSTGSIAATTVAGGNGVYSYAWQSSIVANVISIAGPTKYAGIGPLTYASAFTLEQWVYVTGHANYGRIMETNNSDIAITYVPGTNYTYLRLGDGGGGQFPNAVIPPNTWVHFAITYSATGVAKSYINGVLKDTNSGGSIVTAGSRSFTVYGKGFDNDAYGNWSGSITEMRIWNVERTAAQIAANYTLSLPSTTSGLQLNVTSSLIQTCPSSGIIAMGSNTLTQYLYSGTPTVDSSLTALNYISPQDLSAHSSLKAGSYTLSVTDTASYSSSYVYTLTQNPLLVITPGATTDNATAGAKTGSIGATTVAGGNGVYSYSWASTGTAITAQDLTAKSALLSGTYTLTVTDSVGAVAVRVYTIYDPFSVTAATTTSTGNNGAITLTTTATAAAQTFAWTYYGQSFSTSKNLTGLYSGDYVLTATAGSATKTLTVTVAGTEVLQQILQFNGNLTGYGALSLSPSNPTTTLGTATPTYVTGPFAATQGLKIPLGKYIALPYVASLNIDKTSTFSVGGWFSVDPASTGSLYQFGNTPLNTSLGIEMNEASNQAMTQTWSPALTQTTRSGTISNVNTWHHYWIICAGGVLSTYVDGVLSGSATPALSFASNSAWTVGQTLRSIQNSGHSVADIRWYINGVMSAPRAMIQLVLNSPGLVTNPDYATAANGSITAPSVAFGSAPYTYTWADSTINTAARSNLLPGTYVQTIREAGGTTRSYTYTLTSPALLSTNSTVTNCSTYGASDGAIAQSAVTGGTPPYSYRWSTANGSASAMGAATLSLSSLMAATDYALTVTDSLGYTLVKTITVTEPQLNASVTGTTPNSATVVWDSARALGDSYQIDYINPAGLTVSNYVTTSATGTTIVGLTPSTSYTVKIYKVLSRGNSTRKSLASVTALTTADLPANYNKTAYVAPAAAIGSAPVYDVTKLTATTTPAAAAASLNLNTQFATADLLKATARVKQIHPGSLIKVGDSLTVDKLRSLVLPFTQAQGPGQSITVTDLSTGLTQIIAYDETADTVSIGGAAYTKNKGFRISNKYKVSV